jgi:hypothetical protein
MDMGLLYGGTRPSSAAGIQLNAVMFLRSPSPMLGRVRRSAVLALPLGRDRTFMIRAF